MVTVGDNLGEKTSKNEEENYYCEKCDYKCSIKYNWLRHLSTRKHIQVTKGDATVTQNEENEWQQYCCKKCGRKYDSRNGLWKHKKKCEKKVPDSSDDECSETTSKSDKIEISEDILLEMIQQNNELKKLLVEQNSKLFEHTDKLFEIAKEGKYITNNNTQNNFNLNLFLNEKCKDAISITDFVDSLQLGLSDLELTGQLGYAEGMSQILIKRLNNLPVHERPIHCTNLRNEVLYVKDGDTWTKEDATRSHITLAIKEINKKNIGQIFEWQKKYPDFSNPNSKTNDIYNKLIYNTMSGLTVEEQKKNMNKIIRNISKNVTIDKKLNK